MTPDLALAKLAVHAGIIPVYRDLAGQNQPTSPETKLALLRACGWQLDTSSMIVEAWKASTRGIRSRILPEEIITVSGLPSRFSVAKSVTWHLILEGEESAFADGKASETINIPAIRTGIHELTLQTGNTTEVVRLIAAPKKAPSVFDLTGRKRLWGVNLALYGLHSNRNPGIGDYGDLAQASLALAAHGADFCGINPVHAIGWNSREVISPYSPSHRGFLNTNHIAIDQILPVSDATRALIVDWKHQVGQSCTNMVDYETHAKHHRPLLLALYKDFNALASSKQKTSFRSFREREGSNLADFARFERLSGHQGTDWREWPGDLQRPSDAPSHEEDFFHIWLQWHAESQLQAAQRRACSAGMNPGLYLDLAVGSRRDGAEAWIEHNSVAEGVSIGAPPDHLSPAGQNWNLTAFAPSKLAATNYKAFRTILNRNMRHCGVLRIDHVLGLNRSYWIPDDGSPGGYIKQNFGSMLALVRIEAERNGTVVIGEDLGLVPNGFRQALQDSGIYSYSVLQYEKTRSGSFRKPARLWQNSLACFGTHDTPTLKGFAEERDIDWWQKMNWIDDKSAKDARRKRKLECAQLRSLGPIQPRKSRAKADNSLAFLKHAVHEALAGSPVALVTAQLDDIEENAEAQNLPGTIDEHPNWRRRSSNPVEGLMDHPGLVELGLQMVEQGRG